MITLGPVTQRRVKNVIRNANCELASTLKDLVDGAMEAPLGVTLMHGEEPLGFIITEPSLQVPQMGHTWAVFTHRAKGHGLRLVRTARKYIRDTFPGTGYELVYTFCSDANPEHHKWVEALGFERAPAGDHEDPDGMTWKGYIYHE